MSRWKRKAEAKKATEDAKKFLRTPPPRRPEGAGQCKLCLTWNGHTADCSRNS